MCCLHGDGLWKPYFLESCLLQLWWLSIVERNKRTTSHTKEFGLKDI